MIITISNQKGGVGKTTTAANLAVLLARHSIAAAAPRRDAESDRVGLVTPRRSTVIRDPRWQRSAAMGTQLPEPENEIAIRLHDVVTCLARGDRRAASDQLAPLVGVTCVTHPIVKMPVRSRGE